MQRIQTADSLQSFIGVLSQLTDRYDDRPDLWYRGQSDESWRLQPKFYRDLEDPTVSNEDDIREEFAFRAPDLTSEKPRNEWEWYFLMQHHGAPTRLLDWTDGALIALYFAVRDSHGYRDASVWFLDAWHMNWGFHGIDEVIPPGSSGLWRRDERRYQKWLRPRFQAGSKLAKLPVAIFATHFARRLSTQRSCFTVHGSDKRPLEELYRGPRARLGKIVVPAQAAGRIRMELAECGIDEVTIFPDLDGLGRSVGEKWRKELDHMPHVGVQTRLRPSRLDRDGVGVFALRHIRKGQLIFPGDLDEVRWVRAESLPKRPKEVRKLYEDFAVVKSGRYLCPSTFDRLTPSWYLNDSDHPNVGCVAGFDFRALRDIKPGQELSVDSQSYSDHRRFKLKTNLTARRKH